MLVGLSSALYSQNHSISGSIRDGNNGETVVGAVVQLKGTPKNTFTNPYGFFSLSAPAGTYTLSISYVGYTTFEKVIQLEKDLTINVTLLPSELDLDEVEVSAEATDKNVKSSQMGIVQLDMA
jgi:hypothetical protein